MQEKKYDLVDFNDKVKKIGTKKDAKRLGLYTRSVHIIVRSKTGQILICRRPKNKKAYPGLITSSAGGHVEQGEGFKEAAERELKEELGFSAKLKKIGKFDVLNKRERAIHYLFVGAAKKIVPDSGEISEYYFKDPFAVAQDARRHPRKYAAPFRGAIKLFVNVLKKKA